MMIDTSDLNLVFKEMTRNRTKITSMNTVNMMTTESKIIQGDCRKELLKLKSQSVALVVTSPPYPMIEKWDELWLELFERPLEFIHESPRVAHLFQHEHLERIWLECYRLLIDGGILCINIGDATRNINGRFRCFQNFARLSDFCSTLFDPLIPIFWKNISNRPNAFLGSGMLPPNAYVSQDCEYIGIFRKGAIRKFKTEKEKENRRRSAYLKEERDIYFQQIWELPGAKGAKETSSFPDVIPERLIKMFSVKGDVVLDPFCGTGTTVRVANKLGRVGVGITL